MTPNPHNQALADHVGSFSALNSPLALNHQTQRQVGGDHYRKYKIQPIEYIVANGLSFLAGNVVKYATRYKDKNGAQDIRKAIHYLELILEFEYGNKAEQCCGSPAASEVNSAR